MRVRSLVLTAALIALVPGVGAGAADPAVIRIDEIRIDQPSTDNDEYFELTGPAGASIGDLTYVVLGDGAASAGSGVVEAVVPLSGKSIAADGFFLVTETTFTLGTPDHTVGSTGLNFENDDNLTHMLVRGWTGSNGQDLDTNDDGTLDVTPWTEVVDSVALVKSFTSGEKIYSATTAGPDGSFVPGHVYRLPDGTGGWNIGPFEITDDTPGSANGAATAVAVTIPAIQGAGHSSPYVNQLVRTSGIVTAVGTNGFWLQDPAGDGSTSTSDAVFVFTGSAPTVAPGDAAEVEGPVSEFVPGGAATGNLSTTEILPQSVTRLSSGNPLPAPVVLGAAGRTPPAQTIDDDAFATFDPATDGIDFFESVEAMRVTVPAPVVIAPLNGFGEVWVLGDGGSGATGRTARGGISIAPDDFNPERIQLQYDAGVLPGFGPSTKTGDTLSDATGVVGYDFGNFQVVVTQSFTVTPGALVPETTSLLPTPSDVTVAGFNVLNLDPNDADGNSDVASGQFARIAAQIVTALGSPDVVALQEIQDDTGSANDGTVSAAMTLQTLSNAITAAGGPNYSFIDNPPVNGQDGGEPGGNIRVAFLWNPARVGLVAGSVARITDPSLADGDAFAGSRKPLRAEFHFRGRTFTVIDCHLSSKGGGTPLFGAVQPSVNGSLDQRIAQATVVRSIVTGMLTQSPDANVIVVGDMNEFDFVAPLTILEGSGATALTNLTKTLPVRERYSYLFEGNGQSLDHCLVGPSLASGASYDIVHVNAEYPAPASDHEPHVVRLRIPAPLDTDRDGLTDFREVVLGTNPAARDTDGDGIEDGVEVAIGTNPLSGASPGAAADGDRDGIPDAFDSAPAVADSDGDGVKDGWELARNGSLTGPNSIGDADGSGGTPGTADVTALRRIALGLQPLNGASPLDLDVDQNGVVDARDASLLLQRVMGRLPYLPWR